MAATENKRSRSKSPKRQSSKEQLIQAVLKKRQCKAQAKLIVEHLLQSNVTPEDFLKMIKDINQCHYEDVVEERFILKVCGYPLCDAVLLNVPKKQYQISTSTNKVYDITYRKMFCSTKCFKASEYIKAQMLTSPLWMRDQEKIPEFKILTDS
ncbi:putative RNA polymerase II subunit B1 CTD phosphatase RPAP2 homolog [Episyrphus balteatus]|uniref:putative RNA polymerase II subunit B1 CTD phosphatase RPAP2 homolog n=1 Tax=Episyrphus balteatus TaxID=286459 RepID=UPI00248591FC|nr:putative RNA polymerase II subunit B1 CTD phosphatase RPAP2 homolog [Episyrphus balteatus]